MDKPLRGIVAGATIGLVIVICVGFYEAGQPTAAEKRHDNAVKFISVWKASQLTYFRATQHFKRTRNGKTVISKKIFIDQDPPRWASRSGDEIEIKADGVLVNCSRTGKNVICGRDQLSSYDERLNAQIKALRGYFLSKYPIYEVTKKDKCFILNLINVSYPSPPYGDKAFFCFNDKGNLIKLEVDHGDIRDVNTFDTFKPPRNSDFKAPDALPLVANG